MGTCLVLYINSTERLFKALRSFVYASVILGVLVLLTTPITQYGQAGDEGFGVKIGQHRNQVGMLAATMSFVCFYLDQIKELKNGKKYIVFFLILLVCTGSRGSMIQCLVGKLLGGWGFYEDGQFTTESIENFMLFVPFSILLLWAFQKELLGESPENIRFGKTVWEATKAVAIFSFLIEFTQLLFHLGTLQISDLTYNTLGGAVGGVIYYLGYSRKTKEIK